MRWYEIVEGLETAEKECWRGISLRELNARKHKKKRQLAAEAERQELVARMYVSDEEIELRLANKEKALEIEEKAVEIEERKVDVLLKKAELDKMRS